MSPTELLSVFVSEISYSISEINGSLLILRYNDNNKLPLHNLFGIMRPYEGGFQMVCKYDRKKGKREDEEEKEQEWEEEGR